MPKHSLETRKSTERMVDYDRHSSAQQSIISSHDARIRELARQVGRGGREMRVMDYGCGPGTSAIIAVRPALEVFRARFHDAPLVVCHADQPGNDWNALFGLVYGPTGYHAGIDNVRTEASIGSFYERMADDSSVDLATCFAASHWLSRAVRLQSPGTVWFADLQGDARQEMAELARRDWMNFLRLRARELKPGGFLFVSTLGSIPDGAERNGAAASGRGIYRALQVVAESMARDGLIDADVLDGFVFSLWFPTAEEARSPIEGDDDLLLSFEIVTIEVTPAPHNPTDFFAGLSSDPEKYANAYTGYIRAFADSTLRTQLLAPSATGPQSEDGLADEFYRRLHDLYQTRLSEFAFELWHLTVILRKM
ncbi:hypothetical protein MesoLjLc_31120 [Mesorhizobium sp. L-8-10]|uniref:hypothetical protein n=1 Tax=Mesorhizobium sp. L-8-10 TaxID=2744523 RepID=UPI001926F3A1|nr:hypothetical protein [Mesorhizobium sp. L-8-10]BCH31182.1 hypothetical protein MesoLjLc_31120 [Mesorhizobium sp. L-8-10]